jgi:glycosyltransferase involved in cell wall biosynthesis
MRIVFTTEYFHPFTPGGSAESIRLLAAALVRAGDRVVVLTPAYGTAPPDDVIDGVRVVRFPVRHELRPGATPAPTWGHMNPLFHLRLFRATLRAARDLGADVLHAQEKHTLVGTYLAARRLKKPVFVTLRDYGLQCPIATCLLSASRVPADCGWLKLQRECIGEFRKRYGIRAHPVRVHLGTALRYVDTRLKGAFLRWVDGVVAVSGETLAIYAAARSLATRRAVIHNLPPAPTAPRVERAAQLRADHGLSTGPIVLYVGKRSPGKGYGVFLEAARLVAKRRPDACFVAAGGGDASTSAAADVHVLGELPHDDVLALYDLADVVVHPAAWPEPFSRVLLEAAAAGKPVVATRVGGNPEAVEDGVTGLLVEPGDPGGVADAVARLLDDEGLRSRLGRGAAEAAARRAAGVEVVEQVHALYGQASR